MGKHKKFLRSEKAKVKLKGAKLPKGLNETKTDFKVKKIVIKEQLKQSIVEDGKRIQNIKEIINRLKNQNSSYRTDALKQLKDSISSENTLKHLGEVIQAVAALSLDTERDIRRESFKVLSILFQITSINSIKPFFEILTSYLGCAMTHIQDGIQEDSLLMLDSLSHYAPTLVAANSDKIFSNFLNMISKLQGDSNSKRSLTINTSGRMTTIKWRKKVLDRLQLMFKALLEHRISSKILTQKKSIRNYVNQRFFAETKPMYFSVIRKNLNENCNLSGIFNKTVGIETNKIHDEEMRLRFYIEQLMPLIFQTWLEVRLPENRNVDRDSQMILSLDAAQTLKTVLEIIEHLWDLIIDLERELNNDNLSSWFKRTFREDFISYLLNYFPYQQMEGCKDLKKKMKGMPSLRDVTESGGQFCSQQNLSLIFIFCTLKTPTMDYDLKQIEAILNFIININLKIVGTDFATSFEKALRAILYVNGIYFLKASNEKTNHLLQKILEAYKYEKLGHEMRIKILILLCDIVLNDDLYTSYGKSIFDEWLPTLPKMLCNKTISRHAINTLSNLGKQKNKIFLEALRDLSSEIIENIENLQVVDCDDKFEGWKPVMNLFFWVNDWSNIKFEDLRQHIQAKITNEKIAKYLLYVIEESFNKKLF